MSSSRKITLLSGPEHDEQSEAFMRFRLHYEGPLRPTGRDPECEQIDPLATHKQEIRQAFHIQLKKLWETDRFLKEAKLPRSSKLAKRLPSDTSIYWGSDADSEAPMWEVIANNYRENNYRFVPLVRDSHSLLCSLSILFLRRDYPGSVIQAGDLDNRLKTVIDALRKPANVQELRGYESPREGEDPFFCLMADDKLVSHLDAETDILLEPPPGKTRTTRESDLL